MLPLGSFPITKCYLDHRDGKSGCKFGWGEPATTGVFPQGSVAAPGCTISAHSADRFKNVAGVSRKLGLSIVEWARSSSETGSAKEADAPKRYAGKGSVAPAFVGKELIMPPINESTRHEAQRRVGLRAGNRNRTRFAEFDESRFALMPKPISECKHVINHTVWFVERLDPLNIYHASEDHSHVFDSLLLLPEEIREALAKHRGVQIVFLDPQQDGPYVDFWERISYPNKVRFLHKDPFLPGTCLTGGSIWSIHSERSLLSLGLHGQGWRGYGRGCPSLLLQGFNRWIRDIFADRTHTGAESSLWSLAPFAPGSTIPDMTLFNAKEESKLPPRPAGKGRRKTKWFMDRESLSIMRLGPGPRPKHKRHTILWLSRQTHEATSKQLTSWQSARAVKPSAEECILQRLVRLVLFRNSKQCIRLHSPAEQDTACKGVVDHFWDIENLETSDVTFGEQIEEISKADIIVGVHGAALTHAGHLKPGSAIVELTPGGNAHYKFMTEGMLHRYFEAPFQQNLENVIPPLIAAMRWTEGVSKWDTGDSFPSDIACDKLGI
jgi:hypothetical protein